MKKIIISFLILQLGVLTGMTQTPTPPPPQTKKVIVQTPFGPKEYDVPVDSPPAVPVPTTVPAPPAVVPTPSNAPPPPPASVTAQPAPAAQSAATPQQPDEIVPISLQFDNATDIYGIIKIIMGTLNLNYIIDPAVKGTININTSGNLRRSDLLPILETILKINGATMIKTGDIYEFVPAGSAIKQPLQVREGGLDVAMDDQIVLQVIRMKFVTASEMAGLLTPLLSEGATIIPQSGGNILLIAERRSNLRKLLDIIDIYDTNVFADERVRLFPVKNNLAKDLVSDLTSVFAGYGLSNNATAIKFAALDRINSILVVTPNPAVFPEVEKWLNRLDQNTLKAGIRNFVYRVKNSKAADIQNVLAQLYGGQVQLSSIYNQPSGSPAAAGITAPTPPPNPMGTSLPISTTPASGASFTPPKAGDVRIIADIVNNSLVIQANPQVIQEIVQTIQELDILPRQVMIDAQIYEVGLTASLQFGITAALQNRGTLANPQTTTSLTGSPSTLAGQAFTFIGRTRELVAFLNASENKSRIRTLSAPSVMASDNVAADFQVGSDVPVPTSSSVTPVTSGGTNLFAQTIQFRQTGVLLHVKPQINDGGNVTLQITQEVSEAEANTTSAVVAPVIAVSSVASTISVHDGQTIAIGGFIRESNENSHDGLPILGRIPFLGSLLGNTGRTSSRTELIVLITPHVVTGYDTADGTTDELKAKLKEIQKLLK